MQFHGIPSEKLEFCMGKKGSCIQAEDTGILNAKWMGATDVITRIGKRTLRFGRGPWAASWAASVGKKEKEGPLGALFDQCHEDTTLGLESWEQAESRLQAEAAQLALRKAGMEREAIDCVFAGDLLNQCAASVFGLRELDIPFLGQYGACSTMAQTLGMASVFVEAGAARRALAVTSSHFCSAERQFRLPLEYGGQRTPTAQWTATASGAVIVSREPPSGVERAVVVREATFGRMRDLGVKDAANMGAAMAPAAWETLLDYFTDTAASPHDFDLILTGDLGAVGSDLLRELALRDGFDIAAVHNDGGLMLYDRQRQDVHAGASGCGCSAAVLCSVVLGDLLAGRMQDVLFVGTGALMSLTTSQQGESIPGVAHLIHLRSVPVHSHTESAER